MERPSLSFLGGLEMTGAGGGTPEGDGEVAGVAPTSTSTDVGMTRGIGGLGDICLGMVVIHLAKSVIVFGV